MMISNCLLWVACCFANFLFALSAGYLRNCHEISTVAQQQGKPAAFPTLMGLGRVPHKLSSWYPIFQGDLLACMDASDPQMFTLCLHNKLKKMRVFYFNWFLLFFGPFFLQVAFSKCRSNRQQCIIWYSWNTIITVYFRISFWLLQGNLVLFHTLIIFCCVAAGSLKCNQDAKYFSSKLLPRHALFCYTRQDVMQAFRTLEGTMW